MSESTDLMSRIGILLEGSLARRYDDPGEMVHFAELARAAADHLDSERYGALPVADLRARVWVELGNAYRIADALDLADRALVRAVDYYEAGSRDLGLLALIAERTASLLWHRRNFGAAFVLLDRVARFYRSRGEDSHAARVLIVRGLVTENSGDPESALGLNLEALSLLDSGADLQLRLAGVHNLLMCATELGFYPLVRRLMDEVKPLYGRERLNLLRFRWIEGRVCAGLGETEAAEAAFREVREGFLGAALLFPASLVSLDLARLLLEHSRIAEISGLAEELIGSFRALRATREAVVSLLLLREACGKEGALRAEIAEALERAAVEIRWLSHG